MNLYAFSRLSRPRRLRLSMAGMLAASAFSAGAQTPAPQVFATPGVHTYAVPAGTGSLQVVVKGAAGGAGGWDDAMGGNGVGGTVVTATIAVQGGETVSLLVGEGGEGALGTPKASYGVGAAGGGDGTRQDAGSVTSALPGAGGRGGNQGTLNISPGGAGGGGASQLVVAGAAITAGGGGAGGSNSRIRGTSGNWSVPGSPAVNNLVLNAQDTQCATAAVGGNGENGGNVDGAGGSGGGGSYTGHAGAGGVHGVDGSVDVNGAPGGSGDSCVLDAGSYKITGASTSLGNPSIAANVKGVANPSGENGSISITPVPAPPNNAPSAVPALSGTATVGQVLTGSYSYADTESDPENVSAAGTQYVWVRSATPGLTASSQGTVVQSGATAGTSLAYTLMAADERQYLSYCVTPVATQGTLTGGQACSPALGPVAAAVVPPEPVPVAPAPVPTLGWGALLLASAGLGGLGALLARRQMRSGRRV
ncbi:hypothetical protein [Comamonas odontotermitis]|uniref:hypothetical protein n=1 Tax=Comamonas odontotermitis TaxID=379895 RepID=UPI003753D6FB